eukprot:CAMPEP_0197026542 /NCGR_PEP_ID=MMETSP1384-20130603/6608_1 /TAXON_ID=29189 /ORGANISM="Ammonia sp." /LENGTH=85 /DNA_ID=CAMNT_0042455227 /DNA_START=115 /DNA_END=372 /DNA_ORIENTATION=+
MSRCTLSLEEGAEDPGDRFSKFIPSRISDEDELAKTAEYALMGSLELIASSGRVYGDSDELIIAMLVKLTKARTSGDCPSASTAL